VTPNPLVKVICMECGKKFQVRANTSSGPDCPKCGGADVEVR
jgi:DNA-directed RNA polymerase subunit RPC12/RpoP